MTKARTPQEQAAPDFRLSPKAECCLQRIEASAQRLRETGDVQYIDRMHYDLFKARDSFAMESPDCPDEMEI